MGEDRHNYDDKSLGELERLQAAGDRRADAALQGFAKPLQDMASRFANYNPVADIERDHRARMEDMTRRIAEANRIKAQERAEAVAREVAMVQDMAAMREALESSQGREAAGEEREKAMLRLTRWSVALAALAVVVAVVAVIAQ